MVRFSLFLSVVFFLSTAQANDFTETQSTIRIFTIEGNTLSDIRRIDDREQKTVILEPSITQDEFNIICSRMRWITKLRIEPGNTHITDLSSLRSLRSLEYLEIRGLPIAQSSPLNLEVLERNTNLVELHFHNTPISNTELFEQHASLQKLTLNYAALESVSFLEFLPLLTDLSIDGDNHTCTDFSAIALLPNLRNLSLQSNPQATNENLFVLNESKSLQSISLSDSPNITSFTFLSSVRTLRDVSANNCINLVNTDGLIPLQNLRNVSLDNSPVTSVAFAENKTRLRNLSISNTAVTDLSPLSECSSLARLNISETNIEDISALKNLDNLRRIDASNTPISSTIPFTKLTGLRTLDISYTPITVFEGFENSRQIEDVLFEGTSITDISPLYVLQRISYLRMPHTISQVQQEAVRVRYPTIRIDLVE